MARGYNASADVLETLADGTDLNTIWDEFNSTIALANANRNALVELFCFRTTLKGESVLQQPNGTAEFEDASEYGVPQGIRAESAVLPMGYDFRWKDLASRHTWQFLADASAAQVSALHNAALEADNRLVFKTIMSRLFDPTPRANEDGTTVYGLWKGDDGQTPPSYNGNVFSSTHNHYMTTGSATLDPADVEALAETVLHHGYGDSDGQTLVVLVNPLEGETIAGWRAGVGGAKFDFVASESAPPYLTSEVLVGSRPPGQFQGLKVLGQYGRALIAESYLIPIGYLAALATSGANSDRNPIALREHPLRTGLQIVRGNVPEYPLQDSYYIHGIGTGVRQRGAAAVMKITTGAYTIPVFS